MDLKTNCHDVQMFAQNDFFHWTLKNIVMVLAKEAFNYFALMKTFKLAAATPFIEERKECVVMID